MHWKEIRSLLRSLVADEAKEEVKRTVKKNLAPSEIKSLPEETFYVLIRFAFGRILARLDADIQVIKSKGAIKENIRKTFWSYYFSLVNENSDLARYHEVATMRLALMLTYNLVEHYDTQDARIQHINKSRKRDAILFARRDTKFEKYHREVHRTRADIEYEAMKQDSSYQGIRYMNEFPDESSNRGRPVMMNAEYWAKKHDEFWAPVEFEENWNATETIHSDD